MGSNPILSANFFPPLRLCERLLGTGTAVKRFLLVAILSSALVLAATAQDVASYLAQRKRLGISQATTVAALETLVGERTLEVSGLVKGSIRGEESGVLYLQSTDGSDVAVEVAGQVAAWLQQDHVAVRMLIKARRSHEMAALRAELISAAPEEAVVKSDRPSKPQIRRSTSRTTTRRALPEKPPTVASDQWNLPASDALPYYISFIKNHNKKLPAAEAERIAKGVIGFSLQYGVDARLIMAMVICESDFRPGLVSRAGAMGLGQLMPGTARGLGVKNPFDSVDNLYGTVKLVRRHLDKYQREAGEYDGLVLSLAAYNAGPGAVRRHGGVPPFRETQNYVRKVISTYRRLSGFKD